VGRFDLLIELTRRFPQHGEALQHRLPTVAILIERLDRPPTGYRLVDGLLIPDDKAPTVRRIFDMRIHGSSQGDIARATGVNYSTVGQILKNRAYIGEMRFKDQWVPGIHEPLVSLEVFEAAHPGRLRGRKRGRDLTSGRVMCRRNAPS
jgi:site-specific DNA recombinase